MKEPGPLKSTRLLAGLVMLLLLAAACSPEETVTEEEPEEAPAAVDEEPAPAEPDARVLQGAWHEEQAELNPFLVTQVGKGMAFTMLYDPLVGLSQDYEVIPHIATDWEFSEDGRTITFQLRDDVEWSDGTPLTSQDVIWTFTRYLHPDVSPSIAGRIGGVVGQDQLGEGTDVQLAGLSAPDDYTFVVELEEPNVAWVSNISVLSHFLPILPAHVLNEIPVEELDDHPYFEREHSVTSGPYKFVRWERDRFIELERNDNWSGYPWSDREQYFDRVILHVLDADVATAQLQTGEIQFAVQVSPTEADRLAALPGITVEAAPGTSPDALHFAWYRFPDKRVRQAIIHAIDREGICQQALQGFCHVPLINIRQISPEWALPPQDEVIQYDYDPDRARELLEEAGWDGSETLVLINRPGQRAWDMAVDIVQGNLAAVGIDVEIRNTDTGTLLDMIESGEGWHMFIVGGAVFVSDPNETAIYVRCDQHYPAGGNTSWYCVEGVDELFDAGVREVEIEDRAPIYHEVFKIINDDPAHVYLYVPDLLYAHDSRIQGIRYIGYSSAPFWNVGDWFMDE